MIFLTIQDYEQVIDLTLLNRITENNSALLDKAELVSIEQANGYLRGRYDVQAIFGALGVARNPQLVMCLVDISLYHIYARVNPREMTQIRIDRMENAVDWLKGVLDGSMLPNLPLLPDPDPNTPGNENAVSILMVGPEKRKNIY